jgi:hypothetical protein
MSYKNVANQFDKAIKVYVATLLVVLFMSTLLAYTLVTQQGICLVDASLTGMAVFVIIGIFVSFFTLIYLLVLAV